MDNLDALSDDGLKPLEDAGGLPRWKNQDAGDSKSLEAAKLLDKMLSDLERRREMKPKAVLKTEFPGGSSGSMAASAAGWEAMPGTGPGDEVAGKASPSAWMNKVLKPLEPPADVSTGRTSPAPTLDVALKPSSHHSGTPTGKIQDTTDKISLEPSKQIRQELKEPLQTREGGCISLMLPLGLSTQGLWLHIWTHHARHSGKESMEASLPRCCFHALQGCFPAWPGCSFCPASVGRHLASGVGLCL
ncbi:uncharacterized protein LOC135308414 isoform X2 [Passer domesticus]|uniref:uncharacterized protein LOC135308414 isoform X2 n=1 Tax=Passer domesticus TaxID=48849 RepID=UPI0030FEF6B4